MLVNEQKIPNENLTDVLKYLEFFKSHLGNYFDENEDFVFHEIMPRHFDVDVHWIQPNEKRNYSILVTSGMGSMPLEIPDEKSSKRMELCILLPSDWNLIKNYWPIFLLMDIACYPVVYKTFLDYGHIITESQPLCTETKLMSTLLLKSKMLPEEFQKIKYGEDTIEVYSLFPLYIEELRYENKNGLTKLLQLFEKENISEIIDCNRKNVCENIEEETRA
jgi:hypothetical protein